MLYSSIMFPRNLIINLHRLKSIIFFVVGVTPYLRIWIVLTERFFECWWTRLSQVGSRYVECSNGYIVIPSWLDRSVDNELLEFEFEFVDWVSFYNIAIFIFLNK